MAHSASLSSAATELIYKFAGPSASVRGNFSTATETAAANPELTADQDNGRKFRRTRDAVLRGLRAQQWQRVNQFDVQDSYEGMIEKFIVLDREDLAEALENRIRELIKHTTRWTPEVLALFLALSDRPVEKSKLGDLEKIKPPPPTPPLTWAEIIADDPLDEEGVWDDIDYAAESSEDEPAPKRKRTATRTGDVTPASSVDEDDFFTAAEACVVETNPNVLKEIEDAQFWQKQQDRDSSGQKPDTQITELQAIRETLFMLTGRPTSLFILNKDQNRIEITTKYALSHTITPTWRHQLQEFASIGTGLLQLRFWARANQSIALLQTFRAAVADELRSFDKHIAQLQACCLGSDHAVTVSLIEVMSRVRPKADLLLRLKQLIAKASRNPQRGPFLLLEALYDEINMAQMTGEADLFPFLARIFFRCLQTYLKPIRQWMQEGELGMDDQIFFVGMIDKSSEATSLWHDQYVLRRDATGNLHAPSFLQPAAKKIFNSGKSVVFLRELGQFDTHVSAGTEPPVDFEAVCGQCFSSSSIPLAPFSELFNLAFEDWIRSKYTFASSILRERLFSGYGLWESIDALETVYLSKDGALVQAFADTVFEKFDRGRSGWNDRYVLSEIARSVFGTVSTVHPDKLTIRTIASKDAKLNNGRTVKALGTMAVDYLLPWHIVNVIQRSSMNVYQRVFVFLLQVYRARYVLRSTQLWRSTSGLHDSVNHTDTATRHLQYYLRHRLLWLTDILHSYITETVIASATASFRKELAKAEDIDVMSELHANHVKALESQCLLAPRLAPIHDAIVSLLDLAISFVDITEQQGAEQAAAAENLYLSVSSFAASQRRKSNSTLASTLSRPRRRKEENRRRSSGLHVALAELSDESSSDEDAVASGDDGKGDNKKSKKRDSVLSGSTFSKLSQIKNQFEQQYGFVAAGLRGVSRAGGERCWEMLAERLEWEAQLGQDKRRIQ